MKYSRDLEQLKLKVFTEIKRKTYSFAVEASEIFPLESFFRTELNWAELSYSMVANSSMKDIGRTRVEIHLDRIRDLHLEVWGTARRFSNSFGIEFKYDANRDPSQKLILSYDFATPKPRVYTGNVLISYPDRTLNGKVDLSNEGPYTGALKLSWGADEVIDMGYSVGSEFKDYKKFWAIVKVDTPFNGWRNNKVNGSYYQRNNLMMISFATIWAEQHNIDIDFFVDYLLGDHELSCELKAGIQSSIKDIPIVTTYFKHNQTSNKVDSEILFEYLNQTLIRNDAEMQIESQSLVINKTRTFSMKSSWKRSNDHHYRNVSGSIVFRSPFENYHEGAMITKFSLTKERQIYGVVDVDVDNRCYSFSIEGYMKRLLDNMISFNLTTPVENFPYLLGKFGIIEMKRYVIADLKTLNRSLGIEVLFDFVSITDFDLKFYAATPVFEKILAIGKIKEDTIHIEGAWNKISLGFKGIWHFELYNDFEYSYLIFTPLAHFEENGLIVKFKAKTIQNFDIETSFKLGKYKLGVKAFGEPRTHLINQLGMQKATYVKEDFSSDDDLESEETTGDSKADIDLSKYFSVIGNFEICSILWSPVNGNYEVQQIDQTYHGNAKIYIPKGLIQVSNKFEMRNERHYVNRLKINTPFPDFKSITSNFKIKAPQGNGFVARFEVGAMDSQWRNYGFKLSHTLPQNPELKIHDVSLIVLIPLMNATRVIVNSRLELKKNTVHLASITIDGFKTYMKMVGEFEVTRNDG